MTQEKRRIKRLIAEIPDTLHRRFAAQVALQGKTMKDVVEELIRGYVEQQDETKNGDPAKPSLAT